jgi:hypothetical protein
MDVCRYDATKDATFEYTSYKLSQMMQKGGNNKIYKREGDYFLCKFFMKQKKCYASTLGIVLNVTKIVSKNSLGN